MLHRLGLLPHRMRRVLVVSAHLVLWTVAFFGAYLLRFEGRVPAEERSSAWYALCALLVFHTGSFWFSGLFHGMMRYVGIPELKAIVRATAIATVLLIILGLVVRYFRIPRSIYVGEWVLSVVAASGIRLGIRMFRERRGVRVESSKLKRALVLGAGDAGEMFLRDLARLRDPDMTAVALLDDDVRTHGSAVRGVRILGSINERSLRRAMEDYGAQLAILAMPSAGGVRVREVAALCRDLGLETKTLPGIQQILNGEVRVSMLRDVAIEDLLRRESVHLNEESMARLLRGRRVFITGGAGSIGSELARQALRYEPAALALFDHNENGLFFLERELVAAFPRARIVPQIGDVKDSARVSKVLGEFRPHVILHAAAHKHVPLMEANPAEALKNNVFGTRVVADLALAYGVDTFVLISTDKAVNPTSVMGATKRVAEKYVQALNGAERTRFVAVRFGNVLGSAGSVVQIFREQIARGGPVTVTHPEMKRYFMTISEACQLVLQAGALGNGGEIFLLDMGEPVKIVDLANDMIRMSGFFPGDHIEVQITGMRPGEKLSEELLLDDENCLRTRHDKILVACIPAMDLTEAQRAVDELLDATNGSPLEVRAALSKIVPEARFEVNLPGIPTRAEQALRDLALHDPFGIRTAEALLSRPATS
jgi:FlaA1/EpsC-like NDP-sugar epimerase